MILIDTSYLIAMIDPADELHRRALKWARRAPGSFVVHQLIVVELLNYFSGTSLRVESHRRLEAVLSQPLVEYLPVDSMLHEAAVAFHRRRPDKAWSLTDCVSFVIMQDRGIAQALTFDHHFEQAGFEALLRCEPG